MATQSIIGVIIQACLAGIVFAKFTVPRKRGSTIVFSKNAVITMRNGALYLIARVCDLRKSSLLEAHVRMVIIRKEVTDEGELMQILIMHRAFFILGKEELLGYKYLCKPFFLGLLTHRAF